jgi:large subunit ribosomal protein L32
VALPKRRHSSARRDKRRANWYLKAPQLVACPNCRGLKAHHQACPACGYYGGEKVMKGSQERVHRGRS